MHLNSTDTGPAATVGGTGSLSLDAGRNINTTGATISPGGDLGVSAGNDINTTTGLISGSRGQPGFWHTGDNNSLPTTSQDSSISTGGNLAITASHNPDVAASLVSAGRSTLLSADNNLSLNVAKENRDSRNDRSESHENHAAMSTVTAGDNFLPAAGRNTVSQVAGMATGNSVIIRGRYDANLVAGSTSTGDSYTPEKKKEINEVVHQQETETTGDSDTTVNAGRGITTVTSLITVTDNISVDAGRGVALTTATESDCRYLETKKKSGGFLSRKTTRTISEDSTTREAGPLLSGNHVTINTDDNLMVEDSDVVVDRGVSLTAGNHINVLTAISIDTSWCSKEMKKSGPMGTSSIGLTVGSSKTTHDRRETGTVQSQSVSTIGSTTGNVSITASKQAHISGSGAITNRDISITGDNVVVNPGHDCRTVNKKFEQKKSGLTVAPPGTVGSAINNAVTGVQETKESNDSRLKALQITRMMLSGMQAEQATTMAPATGDPNAMRISLPLATRRSESRQHSKSGTVSNNTLSAGGGLLVVVTDKNRGDNHESIAIAGGRFKASGNTSLDVANDILLNDAANTQKTTGKNNSGGSGVDVDIGADGNGVGINVFAGTDAVKGNKKGDGTEWTEATTDSGKTVIVNSGRDTILNGTQVNGNRIIAGVNRDLLISNQQDTSKYDNKQTSMAISGGLTFGPVTDPGYVATSRGKVKSRLDSVTKQTGMFTGDGGFDITMGRRTRLNGAVIASTAASDKDYPDTGMLGFSDLHNGADYKISRSGINLSGDGSLEGKFQGDMPGDVISIGDHNGYAEGMTRVAAAEDTITIRDRGNQKQGLANLSRNPAHTNDSISPTFDEEKEQGHLQTVGLIDGISSQATDTACTQGELSALKAVKEVTGETLPANATEKQRQEYLARPRDTQAYRNEMAKYGVNNKIRRGVQAATAALQGLTGDNLADVLAGIPAPRLACLPESTEKDSAINATAHTILGGTVVAMQGNSITAGVVSIAAGELAVRVITGMLYPGVRQSNLSEEQKQTISTLATVPVRPACSFVGSNTTSTAVGIQSGKNAVENNSLSDGRSNILPSGIQDHGQAVVSRNQYAQDNDLIPEQIQEGVNRIIVGEGPS